MENRDFRAYFFVRYKLAKTVAEIHSDLTLAFPDSSPGLTTLKTWSREFKKGSFALEKKTSPGRPRETRTPETIATVKRLIEDNPRMTTRQVAAEVSLPQPTVFRIQTEDIGLRNLLSVLVPHQLSEANKTQRVKCCKDLLKLFRDHGEPYLGSHLLVQDESWFYWESAERREVWVEPMGVRFSTPRVKQTTKKTMILMGFTCKPKRVSIQALSPGTTATRETMIEYLRTTGKRFLSLKKDRIQLKDCLLMWDNARPHAAADTRLFLTRRDVEPVKQSPYSPDLNLCDRYLFRKLKYLLRNDEFRGHEEATAAVQRAMKRVSEDELFDQLRKLRDHCHDVIAVGGDYVY